MVPIRLELKNFMSYGTQVMPLDFQGMHLACLSGDNGNGKSAILDAITWAIWGEARASADELIRLGTDEMRVTFDFELNGDIYRVIRGRAKKTSGNFWEISIAENGDGPNDEREKGRKGERENERPTSNVQLPTFNMETEREKGRKGERENERPTSNVQLSTSNEEDAPSPNHPLAPSISWRPLTGQGIRDTEKIIQRILRMDYKTFINSAYIQQGKADEFTKQSVNDRKKILADILDLSRYDALEQKAKERRNDAEQRQIEIEREIGQIETELANEDGYRSRHSDATVERTVLEKKISEIEELSRRLQARKLELDATANRVQELQREAVNLRGEIEELLVQKSDQERRVSQGKAVIQDKDRILTGQKKLHSTRERVATLDKRLEEIRSIDHEKSILNQQILTEKHRLDLEEQSLAKELSELDGKIEAAVSIDKDAIALRTRIAELDKLAEKRAELDRINAEETDKFSALNQQHETLTKETKPGLLEKLEMISKPGAECPLCHTELGHEKHEQVVAKYQQEIADIDARINQLRKEGSESKVKRDAARLEIEKIDRELNAGMADRKHLAQAEHMLFQTEDSKKQRPGLTDRLDKVRKSIASDDYAKEARSILNELNSKSAALEYNPDEHKLLREEISGLEEFETLAVTLKHAEENLPADEAGLRTTCDLISAREKSAADSDKTAADLSESIKELPAINGELESINVNLQSLRESERRLTEEIAVLDHSLKQCEELKKQVSGRKKDFDQARKDRAAYAELVAAFGKKGVQALIIENAIPELNEEANRLLARMTDNSMQVSLETTRSKKSRPNDERAETLDIMISDDMGTRNYELYSGGEAFRINFALRIALSKLLARRAGANLRTLVIDEGFGTQDAKGREKLVEAIDSIKDDFELILVITHIDELKDAFATRIEVSKDSQGSRISVN